MKISKFFKSENKSTRGALLSSMLFPFFLAVISFALIAFHSFYRNREQAQSSCMASMNLLTQRCETEITNVINSSASLTKNPNFLGILNDTADLNDAAVVFGAKDTMLNFASSYPIVQDIFIINKKTDTVFAKDGIYTFDKYFDHMFIYDNYSKEYWRKYRFFDSSGYRILLPSQISTPQGGIAVLPIVMRRSADTKFNNLLIINISIDSLFKLYDDYFTGDNTKLFLLNNYSGDVFFRTDDHIETKNLLDTPLYQSLLNNQSFKYNMEEFGKSLIITHNTSNTLSGYTYFTVIPYSSLNRLQIIEILFALSVFVLFGIITVLFSIRRTDRFITPLNRAIATIAPQQRPSGNILDSFMLAAANMRKLNSDLSSALPFAQEKYLMDYLNSTEYTIDDKTQNMLHSSLLFKNEYFSFVIIQTYPTNLVYETYTPEERANIEIGLYTIIKQLFAMKYPSFAFAADKNVLYIILNTTETDTLDDISNIIGEINQLFSEDASYLNLYAGLGGNYKGWEGLKQAYKEAITNLTRINKVSSTLASNREESLNDAKIAKLYNALISFDTELALRLINEYCQNAAQDQRRLKQLYTQILTTIFKVMRTRNISYNENRLDFEVYSNILSKSCTDIYREIILLLDKIKEAENSNSYENLGAEIIDYINANFTSDDISLESLAELFKVKPTYISTLVKNTLGVGFHKYLTSLRVSKSKELLAHTDMKIDDIYTACGFYSKPTFFRTFKQDTGVTPNEYRKTQS